MVQMQTYLKASAFRQKIEGFKRKIGGAEEADGGGGARRLASDEGREFVFRRDGKPARAPGDRSGGWGGGGDGGAAGQQRRPRGGISAHNAVALAAPPRPHGQRMAPLSTRVSLAAFRGLCRDEKEEEEGEGVGSDDEAAVRLQLLPTNRDRQAAATVKTQSSPEAEAERVS